MPPNANPGGRDGAGSELAGSELAGSELAGSELAGSELAGSELAGSEIVLGVAGGIAAYKAAALASLLAQRSAGVTAVLTPAAERFVGEATFAALTGRPVATRRFDPRRHPLGAHIELVTGADLVVVAPATADLLAKAACGIADDLLTTLLLSAECPVLMAPAMNAAMWDKPAVQRNVRQLADDGVRIIEPGSGWLACRREGSGRMAEPDAILGVIKAVLATRPVSPPPTAKPTT